MGCNCTKESVYVASVKYVIIKRIADGGFGSIDLVEEASTTRRYALKRVNCTDQNELEAKSKENKYYKQLGDLATTTNIGKFLIKLIAEDVVREKSGGFVLLAIMPFYRSGCLNDELESNKLNEPAILVRLDRLVGLVRGICLGLKHIHDADLAHRDLKPHNVLLSDDKRTPVLTDFGSMTERSIEVKTGRQAQELQEWAEQNCSMFYKAPELFVPRVGSSVNEKADIWSLGCLVHAIMFNSSPFDYVAERGDSILLASTNGKYRLGAGTNGADVTTRPAYLVDIVKRTLVVDAEQRTSLTQILEDLDAHANLTENLDTSQINIST